MWTAFIAPDIWRALSFTKYSTSSVVPVLSVQSRTCVGEDSLGPHPFSAIHVHVVVLCCAVAQYIDTGDGVVD